jgi:acyl-CoA synthetase (AMP-forming)/AMP-acid ligase II
MEALGKAAGLVNVLWELLPGGRFAFTTTEIKGAHPRSVRVFKNLPDFLGDQYAGYFKDNAKKTWLVYEGERITFGQAWELISQIGRELVYGLGVKQGDTVGVAMRNLPEYMLSFIAIQVIGAVAVPLNSLWKTEELEYAVKDSGCKAIFADAERMRRCAPFTASLNIATVLVRPDDLQNGPAVDCTITWEALLAEGATRIIWPACMNVHPEDVSMIMYTSGSTGFPKGVEHTHRSLGTMRRLLELGVYIMPSGNVMMLGVPLFHITAVAGVFLRSICTGSTLIMLQKWDPAVALDYIETEKVTSFTGVPTMMRDMMDHPSFSVDRVASLKSLAAGGAPVPPSQVKQMASKVKNAGGQVYGLTEVIVATTIAGKEYQDRPKSCGKAAPLFVELAIKDPETGKTLPPETRGEICIKSAMVMKGYHNQPEKTAEVMDSEGFFHSGDVGRLDSSGYLYIMDRLKDIIIRGGENIDCSEVEAALYTHPAAREVSVFGLPDERLGEVVGAAVWCTDAATPEELSTKAAEALAKFKVPLPEHIFILNNELPKGATGKIDKKGLRAKFSEQFASSKL